MQLENATASEVLEEEEEGDLHVLLMDPEPFLGENDVAMNSLLSPTNNLYEFHASTENLDSAVSGIQCRISWLVFVLLCLRFLTIAV